jgi:formylglycine-generating enzyme required for sulfatase activity
VYHPQWPLAAVAPQPLHWCHFEGGTTHTGHSGEGFAFDNELGAHAVTLPACRIDAQVLRWGDYLPFVQAGGSPRGQVGQGCV